MALNVNNLNDSFYIWHLAVFVFDPISVCIRQLMFFFFARRKSNETLVKLTISTGARAHVGSPNGSLEYQTLSTVVGRRRRRQSHAILAHW